MTMRWLAAMLVTVLAAQVATAQEAPKPGVTTVAEADVPEYVRERAAQARPSGDSWNKIEYVVANNGITSYYFHSQRWMKSRQGPSIIVVPEKDGLTRFVWASRWEIGSIPVEGTSPIRPCFPLSMDSGEGRPITIHAISRSGSFGDTARPEWTR